MAASRTADKVNEASGELRKANEALVQKEVRRANLQTRRSRRPCPKPSRQRPDPTAMRAVSRRVVLATPRQSPAHCESAALIQRAAYPIVGGHLHAHAPLVLRG
jgi:hypothetical protein